MWTWLKGLWADEDYAARALKALMVGLAVYLSTPPSRGWERAIPALLAVFGSSLPSSKPRE
jgi:hypothetical protein